MHTIVTDNQITRNRKVHHVVSPEDMVVFSSPLLADCIEWLRENDIRDFYIDFGDFRLGVRLPTCPWEGDAIPLGWLHRPKEAEPEDGADAQAATHIATL